MVRQRHQKHVKALPETGGLKKSDSCLRGAPSTLPGEEGVKTRKRKGRSLGKREREKTSPLTTSGDGFCGKDQAQTRLERLDSGLYRHRKKMSGTKGRLGGGQTNKRTK